MKEEPRRIALAITGASGVQYAFRLLECLLQAGVRVHLMISKPGQVVVGMDTDWTLPSRPADIKAFLLKKFPVDPDLLDVYGPDHWTAPVASGSGVPEAMVVCPCTTGTLAAMAAGNCNNLMERAADVVLKERKTLILMPREMPFSSIHLENMLRLSRAGAIIMPPNPAFYTHPKSVDEMVDFVVARVLDQLDVAQKLMPRWGLDD
ncbi:MAG: flavin prenyltransferase UbiX [Granulosicoccaceae bacterium]